MDKKFLIIANNKANITNLQYPIPDAQNLEIAIATPFPFIENIPENFFRAAQNVSTFSNGPYTGEVTADMLKILNVKYCLVGHSERRKYFHETNDQVQEKISQLLKNGIVPIVCAQDFDEIPNNIEGCLVMYEPFSAISTQGKYHSKSPNDVNEILTEWQMKLPKEIKFLYGGSVNPENAASYIANCPLVAGFVVGNASLTPDSFNQVIESVLKAS